MASTFPIVRAVRVMMCAGSVLGLSLPAAAQAPAPPAQAQQAAVREELDKLRKEFEAVRDAYGARLAALEEKLTAMGAPTAPACAPAQGGRAGGGPDPDGRGRGRRADGCASGLRQHERAVEDLQP